MSKTLDDILKGTSEADISTADVVNGAVADDSAAATAVTAEPAGIENQTAEEPAAQKVDKPVAEKPAKQQGKKTEAPKPETIPEPLASVAQADVDEVESAPEATVEPITTFEPKQVRLTKSATLYANMSATKVIGVYKGIVRQVGASVNGVAPIEYTIVSCGNKVTKRAYIHI